MFALQKTILDLQEGTNRKYARVKESFNAMNHNLRKIAAQPVAVRRHKKRKSPSPLSIVDHAQVSPDSDEDSVDFSLLNQPKRRKNAVLFPRPKTLHVLWQEYEKGVGTNVAARNFTPSERGYGSIRFTYSKRKVFWDFVIKFLNRDESASSVCERIHAAYPGLTVTKIIEKLRTDQKKNTLPADLVLDPNAV